MFQEWVHDLAAGGTNPTRINTQSEKIQDVDHLVVEAIDALMKDGATRHGKVPIFNNSHLTPREMRALKRNNLPSGKEPEAKRAKRANTQSKSSTYSTTQCVRTVTHPAHVISTTIPPAPIATWPDKQSADDIPKDMTLIPENHKR